MLILVIIPNNIFNLTLLYNGRIYSIILDVFYTFYYFIYVFTMLHKKD